MMMNCPTCNISLVPRTVSGEVVDQCSVCNGTWYDQSELSSVIAGDDAGSAHKSVEKPASIICPKCDLEIEPTIYAHDSGIPILKCSVCSGVWLLEGQLNEIAVYRNGPHKTDQLAQAMAETYAEADFLDRVAGWLQSRIVSTIFAVIMLVSAFTFGAGAKGLLRMLAFLVLPMACIWYSDAMGNLTGMRLGRMITQTTPGIAVAMGGWILMLTALGVMIYAM